MEQRSPFTPTGEGDSGPHRHRGVSGNAGGAGAAQR